MIQRKQSLFLLIGTIVMALLYFFPIAEFMVGSTNYYFNFIEIASSIDGEKELVGQVYPVTVLLSIIVLVSWATIFLFKNRPLQLRLITINVFFKIGFLILVGFYIYKLSNAFDSELYLQMSFIYPVIAIVLDIMASKGIQKDLNIIKSYDRLR